MCYRLLLFAALGFSDYFTPVLPSHFSIEPTHQNFAWLANLSLLQTTSTSLQDYPSVSLTVIVSPQLGSHDVSTNPSLIVLELCR